MPQTLYDKIWNEHVVHQQDDGTALIYFEIVKKKSEAAESNFSCCGS
jgi:homoaconitase/3-isopropylmalate dehydratase large subunit